MLQKYIDRAIYVDMVLVTFIIIALVYFEDSFRCFLKVSNPIALNDIHFALIGFGGVLIGFMLTIITVIVTFKKGFQKEKESPNDKKNEEETNYDDSPRKTIFGKVISKEKQFYNTEIHVRVVKVFATGTYEMAILIGSIFMVRLGIIELNFLQEYVITLLIGFVICLILIRSFIVFRIFLNVHL